MLSNKSQYILSKIGIPLYTDAKNLSVSDEINIHFFQKDNILTLHANSVDEYSEKEIKLLEAIIAAIHGTKQVASKGAVPASSSDPVDITSFQDTTNLKATLVFFDPKNLFDDLNLIISPPLKAMLTNPNFKKDLWSKLKPLQSA